MLPGFLCRSTRLSFLALTAIISTMGCALRPEAVPKERYERALELIERGTESLRKGRLAEADAAYSASFELAPLAPALDGQGCVALLSGELERAEELFNSAYEIDRKYDHALANLALLHDIQGKFREAKRLYDRVIAALPDDVAARNNRAALEYDRGASKIEVVRELEKAALVGKHEVVHDNLTRLRSGAIPGMR
jgi:tetratricopeptide (TPR) repeat protein